MDIFYRRKTHMLLVFNGVLCSTLIWTLIQLSNIIHYPYIRDTRMKTLKKHYHIGKVPAKHDQRSLSL